jgi:glycosyltransferase involved in cell wall biosynthesis
MKLVFHYMSQQFALGRPYTFDYRRQGLPACLPFGASMWPTAILKALTRRGFDTTLVFIETLDFVRSYFSVESVAEFEPAPGLRIVYCADTGTASTLMSEAEAIVIRHDYTAYQEVFSSCDIGDRPVILIIAGRRDGVAPRFVPDCRNLTFLVNSPGEANALRALGLASEVFLKPAAELFYEPPPHAVEKAYDCLCIMWDTVESRKRFDLLLDALPVLDDLATGPLTVASIGRSEAHAERIARLNRTLKRVRVERLGVVGRDEARVAYHRSRLTVVPSRTDANPQVIGESLACGVPVACATDLTGGLFQITPRTGRTFAPEPDALARTVVEMLTRPGDFDPARHCVTIGQAARQVAELALRRAP